MSWFLYLWIKINNCWPRELSLFFTLGSRFLLSCRFLMLLLLHTCCGIWLLRWNDHAHLFFSSLSRSLGPISLKFCHLKRCTDIFQLGESHVLVPSYHVQQKYIIALQFVEYIIEWVYLWMMLSRMFVDNLQCHLFLIFIIVLERWV